VQGGVKCVHCVGTGKRAAWMSPKSGFRKPWWSIDPFLTLRVEIFLSFTISYQLRDCIIDLSLYVIVCSTSFLYLCDKG
jgi:hypothetical protein